MMKALRLKNNVLILLIASVLLTGLSPAAVLGQAAGTDSITCSSTCVNATAIFGSTIFNTIVFPQKVIWNFGDPASGIYNTAAGVQPRHIFSGVGTYNISLAVVRSAGDTVFLKDTLTVTTPMTYNFGPDVYLCEGKDTFLVAPVVPGAVYTWNDDSTTHSDTLHVTQSGLYTVAINGCGVTDSVGVYTSTLPKIELGNNHILCNNEQLTLDATTQNGQYTWLLDGNPLPDNKGQLPVIAPGGTYVAIVGVPGCGVYRDTARITFSSPDAPAFSLGPDTLLCPKQVITLTATAAGATAYDWNDGAFATPSIRVDNAGFYYAFVTINGQCQVVDTVEVKYRGDKKLDFHDTAICKGSSLSLDADFGTGSYKWEAIPPQRDDQNQTGQATYYVYRPGTYSITATVGICVYMDTLTVRFDDSLRPAMAGDTSLCRGEDYWLHVTGNVNTYAWQDGSISADYKVTTSGVYTVVTENGCGKDTLTASINFVTCSCNLMLPNAFSPDGNGQNDTFRPLHACQMSDYQMAIYDRYGDQVFLSSDPGRGWNGSFRGAKAPSGSYVWMVRYFNTDLKQPVFKKGFVVLVR